jgi:hypothetical protein
MRTPDINELAAIQHNTEMANLRFGAGVFLFVAVLLAFAECRGGAGGGLAAAIWLEYRAQQRARLWRERVEEQYRRKEVPNGE